MTNTRRMLVFPSSNPGPSMRWKACRCINRFPLQATTIFQAVKWKTSTLWLNYRAIEIQEKDTTFTVLERPVSVCPFAIEIKWKIGIQCSTFINMFIRNVTFTSLSLYGLCNLNTYSINKSVPRRSAARTQIATITGFKWLTSTLWPTNRPTCNYH